MGAGNTTERGSDALHQHEDRHGRGARGDRTRRLLEQLQARELDHHTHPGADNDRTRNIRIDR
jgi:hypothetical protein